MKIALDIHGVIDKDPKFFANEFCNNTKNPFNKKGVKFEIHILTGVPITKELKKELLSYNNNNKKWWSKLFSITDYLLKTYPKPTLLNEKGRYVFDDELWNSAKGNYCKRNKINICLDNTEVYKKYMPEDTIFILYK